MLFGSEEDATHDLYNIQENIILMHISSSASTRHCIVMIKDLRTRETDTFNNKEVLKMDLRLKITRAR